MLDAIKDNTEVVRALLAYNACVNTTNKDGFTALSMACYYNSLKTVHGTVHAETWGRP